ncbi:hypothetical protein H7J87_13350 [Mycolicibacterium wolinskyi]|uniref:Uncharacterized protein n=1 Tax=Mycolicibacterium wolinskyi TaxID=59750 RepID=A0A1X2F916_9MYCO|nr:MULTISPECIES: hypothetical protein [Mycolicibacterium]MCV7286314.1 hypothetical protein [Mycolicibacterium wolinskyi]MCV7293294.1 hypothetical protein [Mycolicibacterium goodii]ORX14941.1 hypothetical protein AWC31_27765 [Mycolicibacterium wolinskyi]
MTPELGEDAVGEDEPAASVGASTEATDSRLTADVETAASSDTNEIDATTADGTASFKTGNKAEPAATGDTSAKGAGNARGFSRASGIGGNTAGGHKADRNKSSAGE